MWRASKAPNIRGLVFHIPGKFNADSIEKNSAYWVEIKSTRFRILHTPESTQAGTSTQLNSAISFTKPSLTTVVAKEENNEREEGEGCAEFIKHKTSSIFYLQVTGYPLGTIVPMKIWY